MSNKDWKRCARVICYVDREAPILFSLKIQRRGIAVD